MFIDMKQLKTESDKDYYVEYMSTSFPELLKIENIVQGSNGYTLQVDEENHQFIHMDKGAALEYDKLPSQVNAVFSNAKKAPLNIYWYESIPDYNPNKGGEQVLYARLENGVWNPRDIAPKLRVVIDRSGNLSLSKWWANGAKVNSVSYANGKTAKDFEILEDYYITNLEEAFMGASEIESLPTLTADKLTHLTNMARAFKGCSKLQSVSFTSEYVTDFTSAFEGCESLTSMEGVNFSNVQKIAGAFNGCKKLAKLPNLKNLESYKATDYSNAFKNCSSLPSVFPYVLNMSSIVSYQGIYNMFAGSSVKEVTIKVATATPADYFCPLFMGNNLEKITIVGTSGDVITVRTKADNPETVSFLTGGESKLTVPEGVTSAKVALLSGVKYRFIAGDVDRIGVTGNPSSISRNGSEVISSLKTAGCREHYFDWTGTQEQHGGVPAEFDAQYEDYSKKVYCCGVGGGKQYTKYTNAWAALDNSFVQDTIDVTPGEELTIMVGVGGASGSCTWNKKPSDGVYNGYVLLQFQ
jgi:hypothetical protein